MRILLLFTFLTISFQAAAQSDSTKIVSASIATDSLVRSPLDTAKKVICTDTVRLGNFYAGIFAGTRLAITKGPVPFEFRNTLLTDWGKNLGFTFGYKTRNGRFLLETGYYQRTLDDINRLHWDKVLTVTTTGNMTQIPLLLKMKVWQHKTQKFKVRAIAGVNYTKVSEDYSVEGNFKLISKDGNVFRIRSFDSYRENEPLEFDITRRVNTSKNGTNNHLTAEGGFEGSFQVSRKMELGSVLTYQYASGNLEELKVVFLGHKGSPSPRELPEPYNDDPALNFAFYLRYNFDPITFVKCKKTVKP